MGQALIAMRWDGIKKYVPWTSLGKPHEHHSSILDLITTILIMT